MRKRRALFSLLGIILLTYIIHSYKLENGNEDAFPKILFGIPTYPDSTLNTRMSSLTGNPYVAVFLSNDPHEKIVAYYKEKLKRDPKLLELGREPIVTMRIYQFQMEASPLPKSIGKGVEVIGLNSRSQQVHNAKTKIKIILPRLEVNAAIKKREREKALRK